jgi:hypothetical protein
MRSFLLCLVLCVLCGCSQNQLTVGWYAVEGVGYLGYDRYKRSDDVILVKGVNGEPNLLCMRRGKNILWGPSAKLQESSGLTFWEYVERNRKIQIYENVAAAKYGKYKFVMTPETEKAWKKHLVWMGKKYSKRTDYNMYEHLLRKRALINEAVSELKQEQYLFKHRND